MTRDESSSWSVSSSCGARRWAARTSNTRPVLLAPTFPASAVMLHNSPCLKAYTTEDSAGLSTPPVITGFDFLAAEQEGDQPSCATLRTYLQRKSSYDGCPAPACCRPEGQCETFGYDPVRRSPNQAAAIWNSTGVSIRRPTQPLQPNWCTRPHCSHHALQVILWQVSN